jgi:hypothetical protein
MADDNRALVEAPRPARVINQDVVPIFDTGRFEQYGRIAAIMAAGSLTPDSLRTGGHDVAVANCFQVVEMADRWGMSPFLVAQSAGIVYGKLVFEGKLIAAVLAKLLDVRLYHYYAGQYGSDDYRVFVSDRELTRDEHLALRPHDQMSHPPNANIIDGSVGEWKTFEKDNKTTKGNWLKQPDMQLIYRGDRTWGRAFQPGVMLGVIGDDEIEDWRERRDVGAAPTLSPAFPAPQAAIEDKTPEGKGRGRKARKTPSEPPEEAIQPEAEVEVEEEERPTAEDDSPPADDQPEAEAAETASEPGTEDGSPGTGEPTGESEAVEPEEVELPAAYVEAIAKFADAQHWEAIKQVARTLAKADAWKLGTEAVKEQFRQRMWLRYVELRDAGVTLTPIPQDMTLMGLWLNWAAKNAEEIDGLWRPFFRSEAYKNANEADRMGLVELMQARKKALA